MTDSKKIDLIIRAEVENADKIAKVSRSIGEIQEAIRTQVEAAKRGKGSIDDLKAAYAELDEIAEKLKSSANLGAGFLRTAEAIEKTERRVAATKKRFDEFSASLGAVDQRTEAQETRLLRLRAAFDTATSKLNGLNVAYKTYGDELTRQGVDLKKVEQNQSRLEQSATELGLAYAQGKNAIREYNANLAEFTKRSQEAAQEAAQAARGQAIRDKTLNESMDRRMSALREAAELEKSFIQKDFQEAELKRETAAREEATAALRRQAREEDRLLDVQERAARRLRESAQDQLLAERGDQRAAQAKREAAAVEILTRAKERRAQADKRIAQVLRESETKRRELYDEAAKENAAIDAARAKAAALAKVSDAAVKTASSMDSMLAASKNLSPEFISLAQRLRDIADPAAKSRSTLQGLVDETRKLAAATQNVKGPVKEYQTTLSSLAAVVKQAGQQAGLIDSFRQTAAVVKANRAEYTAIRAKLLEYAQAVKSGVGDTEANVAALREQQAALTRSAAALRASIEAARGSREALRAAGISANDLAGTQARLVAVTAQATVGQRNLTAAVAKFGVESDRAKASPFLGGGGISKGINVLGFLRQEIIGATAAVVSLYGAFDLARKSIEALSTRETIKNKIAVAIDSNDVEKIGVELDYVRKKADYFGVAINDMANAYGSFSIASKSAGFSVEQNRYAFEQLSGGMRVLGLNADQTNRAFVQVQQILSKTKPELEDIKTIAEAGFAGVQGLIARGLRQLGVAGIRAGTEIQDMAELMKKGLLDSQTAIYALAVASEKELGDRIPAAIRSLRAEQGRFATSVQEFQMLIAESGFADAYKAALIEIREFFASAGGKDLARNISTAFATVADAIIFVIKNLEEVKTITVALASLWAVNMVSTQIISLASYVIQLRAVEVAGKGAATAMQLLSKYLIALQAGLVGYQIGKYIFEEFELGRRAAVNFSLAIQVALASLKAFGSGTTLRELAAEIKELRAIADLDILRNQAPGATKSGKILGVADRRSLLHSEYYDAEGVTPRPPAPKGTLAGGDAEKKAAAKAARLLDQVENALNALEARVDRSKTESLATQLGAVEQQYEKLRKDINRIGDPEERSKALSRLAAANSQIRIQIITSFTLGIEEAYGNMLKSVEGMEAKAGKQEKLDLEARLGAIRLEYREFYRDLKTMRNQYAAEGISQGPIDALEKRAKAAQKELEENETKKVRNAQLVAEGKKADQLIEERAAKIDQINAEEAAGVRSSQSAYEERNRIIAESQPKIVEAADAAIAFAEAMKLAQTIEPAAAAAFIAKMQNYKASLNGLKQEAIITGAQINQMVAGGAVEAFDQIASSVAKAARGTQTWGDTLRDVIGAFGQFAAEFLKKIAQMILQQIILNALQTGNYGTTLANAANGIAGGKKHSGGLIGGTGNVRSYPANWFANAPRYHSGGIAGLASDEYPTILQRNEEVLSKSSPRNILNGGGAAAPTANRFVLVDDRSKVPEAMASADGERVIVEVLRRNQATVRKLAR